MYKSKIHHYKIVAAAVVLGGLLPALSTTPVLAGDIAFPVKVGERPESITPGFDGKYFVTLFNGNEKRDGEVRVITADGTRPFAQGLDEPKGIVFLNDHLFVADLLNVVKIDNKGKVTVFAAKEDFPHEIRYLNDVAVDPSGKGIYVTDMGATDKMRDPQGKLWPVGSQQAKDIPAVGRVYHIDLNGKVTIAQDANRMMTNPNGVGVANDGTLLIGAFFNGLLLKQNGNGLKIIAEQMRGADAVEQGEDGYYYVSSIIEATVWKIDPVSGKKTILKDGLESAADFYLDEENKRLLLPDMKAGMVYAIGI